MLKGEKIHRTNNYKNNRKSVFYQQTSSNILIALAQIIVLIFASNNL